MENVESSFNFRQSLSCSFAEKEISLDNPNYQIQFKSAAWQQSA